TLPKCEALLRGSPRLFEESLEPPQKHDESHEQSHLHHHKHKQTHLRGQSQRDGAERGQILQEPVREVGQPVVVEEEGGGPCRETGGQRGRGERPAAAIHLTTMTGAKCTSQVTSLRSCMCERISMFLSFTKSQCDWFSTEKSNFPADL
ncbi:hypothetical protein F7725_013037, partial [Dissostichus mawsoni]